MPALLHVFSEVARVETMSLKLSIRCDSVSKRALYLEGISPEVTVEVLLQQVLSQLDLPTDEISWCLLYQGVPLRLGEQIRFSLPTTETPIELVLLCLTSTAVKVQKQTDEGLESVVIALQASANDDALEKHISDLELEEDIPLDLLECECESEVATTEGTNSEVAAPTPDNKEGKEAEQATCGQAIKPRKTVQQATVRYYNRMNPQRVYPLLVLITRDMVEGVRKRDTTQRSSKPFEVDETIPVEIEPVLPGCDCHPPKIVARLGAGELTTIFRIVPRVLGKVDGATVMIRQDHNLLAEVALEVKVVQRGWVALSGAMTFLVPGLSAILKHFGIDFASQKDEGFSPYLAAAHILFDWVSPLVLTTGLGLVTGLVWWFTRPQSRDVFWDIKKVGPAERLKQIADTMQSDLPQPSQDLLNLLTVYPDYQPARLLYAECHSNNHNYVAALAGYEQAFQLGVAKAGDYHKASCAASKLGRNETALRILQEAERVLPPDEMTGVMLYNMGCYYIRLGDSDKAMAYLKRAMAAGYRKLQSFQTDPDLDPLRLRADFQHLLTEELSVHFRCCNCDKALWAKAKLAGRETRCPRCSTKQTISASD